MDEFRFWEPEVFYFSLKNLKYFISTVHHCFSPWNFKSSPPFYPHLKKCQKLTKLGERGLKTKKQLIWLISQELHAPLLQVDKREEAAYNDLAKWIALASASFQVHEQIQEGNFLRQIKKPLTLFHLRIFRLHSRTLCSSIWHTGRPPGQLWAHIPTPKKKYFRHALFIGAQSTSFMEYKVYIPSNLIS